MRRGLKQRSLVAAMAALALSAPAGAQDDGVSNSGTYETGENLHAACTSEDDVDLEHCYAFIMGVADAVVLFSDYGWLEPSACVPNEVTIEELRDVVVKYIEASDRYYSAVSMVHSALEEAYPCDSGTAAGLTVS